MRILPKFTEQKFVIEEEKQPKKRRLETDSKIELVTNEKLPPSPIKLKQQKIFHPEPPKPPKKEVSNTDDGLPQGRLQPRNLFHNIASE